MGDEETTFSIVENKKVSRQQQGMLTMLRGLFAHEDASWSSALEDAARTKILWLLPQLLRGIEQL
eukprot:16255485-Heterocapsa_arctica.AAC.1